MSKSRAISSIKVPLVTDTSGIGGGLKSAATAVDKFYAGIGKTLSKSPFGVVLNEAKGLGTGLAALSKSVVAPLKPVADGIGAIGKQAKAGIADVSKLALGLGAMAAAGAATIGVFAKGGLKRIGELGDTSLQLGIASDKLSELQYAALATGASAEDLNGFLAGLNATVHASIGTITPASEAFTKLGTSAEELTKLTPDKQFEALKKGFDALPDAASKADAAVKIGGEAGLKLFKLLGMGATEFEALKKKSGDVGFTVSPEALAKVQATNAAFAQIGSTVDGVVNQLTVALAPAVGYVADAFTNWFATTTADSKFFDKLVEGFVGGLGGIADTAVGLSLTFRDVFASIGQSIGSALTWISKLLDAVAYVVPGMAGVAESVKAVASTVGSFGDSQAKSAAKAREAFEAAKPSASLTKAYESFKAATDAKAAATVKDTVATQAAATANTSLADAVSKLKQDFSVAISDAGLTAEQKQVEALKKQGAGLKDIVQLTKMANQVREAGKKDSLAEDLRESTKLPYEKLTEDLGRINQLLKEGKITQAQALRGAAAKTRDSGIAGGQVQFAGALQANTIEGRSYLLSQQNRQDDPVAVLKQGLALTGQTNSTLGQILNTLQGQQSQVVGFN